MKISHTFILRNAGPMLFIFCFYVLFFSPIIFSDRLLAFGDGLTYYLPNFYSGILLWDPLIASGFPAAADPQTMTWYPPAIVLANLTGSWNLFVMLAYMLATYFMFSYVHYLTESLTGAIVAGFAFGLSGFMSAHMDHTSIIHSAVWLPLILLAVEKIRRCGSVGWLVIGAIALCCCALAGHPQIFVYTALLCCAYVFFTGFGTSTCMRQWKFFCAGGVMLLLGFGLAALLFAPAMELGNLSLRQKLSFNEFNSYSLPADQILGLLFPYLFGGSSACPFWQPYFGLWNHGELTGYAGLTTLILAAVGIVLSQEKLLKWFYLAVAAVAILLALGDATPLARFVFHLPGLNKFRAPARHLLEFTFAVSLLAGLGVAAIEKQSGSAKRALFPLLIGSGVIFGALLTTYLLSDRLKAMALKKGIEAISFVPWSNPALGLPTIILLLAILTAILWLAKPSSWVRRTLLVAVLIVDVGSYSFHTSVLYFPAASKDVLTPPAFVDAYRESLAPEQQRLLSVRGWQVEAVVPPNLSRLWNVPSAGCYGPLMISRVGTLLGMDSSGYVYGPWFDDSNQTLDVLAVKYVFDSKPGQNRVSIDADHYKWAPENGNLKLGSSCGNHVLRKEAFFKISPPFRSTGIGIVSLLVCSTEIKNNEAVLEVAVEDSAANVQIQTVRAGRDSSEWAYGCAAVARPIQHEQACVFDSVPGRDCEGHRYVAFLPFEGAPEVKEIRLRWTGTSGAIIIDKMSLFNELDRQAYLIDPSVSSVEGVKRWRQEAIEVPTRVYRNLRAMPRAWLVPETVSARPEEILSSVQSSTLPDGRSFDCSRIALVEEPLAFKVENFDKTAKIKNLSATNTRVKLRTSANSPSFLVLSDVNYPGWRVTIDGKKEHLYQANYVSRGVIVPAGEHEIVFRFRPTMFYFGLAISAFSAVSILLIVIFRKKIAGLFGEPSR